MGSAAVRHAPGGSGTGPRAGSASGFWRFSIAALAVPLALVDAATGPGAAVDGRHPAGRGLQFLGTVGSCPTLESISVDLSAMGGGILPGLGLFRLLLLGFQHLAGTAKCLPGGDLLRRLPGGLLRYGLLRGGLLRSNLAGG